MTEDPSDGEGQLYTLGLLEQLRVECKALWGASSDAYFRVDELLRELANPNLHDLNSNMTFRVELWDRHAAHIRWVVAAANSIPVASAAFDAAIASWPDQHFTLRQGIRVLREHPASSSK